MKIRITSLILLLLFSVCGHAQTLSPREQLQQMVEQLQKTPNDNALRERIVKLGAEIKPAPAIPEEAERRMARGSAAYKGATSVAGYQDAAKEFEQASLAAPWFDDAYFNLGLAQDKAGNYEAALRSLGLAQLASRDDSKIKALIYEVEYRLEKAPALRQKAQQDAEREAAARAQAAAAAREAREKADNERLPALLEGAFFDCQSISSADVAYWFEIRRGLLGFRKRVYRNIVIDDDYPLSGNTAIGSNFGRGDKYVLTPEKLTWWRENLIYTECSRRR